jgi:predicted RNase H-like HicB family nuclease
MNTIEPLRIEVGPGEDGRYCAAVPELPGVRAYGETREAALRRVKAIALEVLAEMIDGGEELPPQIQFLFTA